MKVEKLPSGSYRVRKTYKKQLYTITFPYKPSQKEILSRFAEMFAEENVPEGTVSHFIDEYIDSKRNVLSPNSVRTYERYKRSMSKEFLNIRLSELSPFDVQCEISQYAKDHEPKSVKCYHGFIASVVGLFRPQLVLKTTLPQNIEKDRYTPSEKDIKAILDYAEDTEDSIGFQLGVLGLRESEIVALELSDLKGNALHIHANMVRVKGKGWVRKECPKTDAGNRTIYIPGKLAKEIRQQGYYFKYTAPKLLEHLHKVQNALNIPTFRFHDLRVFFASYASTLMSESDAMALGGWKSDYTFKKIYRKSLEKQRKQSAQKLIDGLFS